MDYHQPCVMTNWWRWAGMDDITLRLITFFPYQCGIWELPKQWLLTHKQLRAKETCCQWVTTFLCKKNWHRCKTSDFKLAHCKQFEHIGIQIKCYTYFNKKSIYLPKETPPCKHHFPFPSLPQLNCHPLLLWINLPNQSLPYFLNLRVTDCRVPLDMKDANICGWTSTQKWTNLSNNLNQYVALS